MSDIFNQWVLLQEQAVKAQQAQLDVAMKAMGMQEHFVGAAKAAQDIGKAQVKAWESWMAMWGGAKK